MTALPTAFQQQIHAKSYARWREEDNRRETWEESVDRYLDQQIRQTSRMGWDMPLELRAELRHAIENLDVMGSMRQMMTAGPALEKHHAAGYNCTAVPADSIESFAEILYLLSLGTGVGFSVEHRFINKLPEIPLEFKAGGHYQVPDDKIGWADSVKFVMGSLYRGEIPTYSTELVRPKGSRLKTFGGRASGPEPLHKLLDFIIATFDQARGRKLKSTEVHEIICMIGYVIVSGGVRRSALLCLFDPWDTDMATVKSFEKWDAKERPWLGLANNSAVWEEKPSYGEFRSAQWEPLVAGMSGEPGIINRQALRNQVLATGRRDPDHIWMVNPCAEIILRPMQLCNLSEVIARPEDEFEDLIRKVRFATILGVIQSTYTDFIYLRPEWKKNAEEERLLGVSITGQVDNPILNGSRGEAEKESVLHALKNVVLDVSAEYAGYLGINVPAATTCVKPSGTVSKLVMSGSGMNEWYAKYYYQRIRTSKTDPIGQLLYMSGVHTEDDLYNESDFVMTWPMKAPEGALTRHDVTAIEKLGMWKSLADHWCEHNPSVTVNVRPEEWDQVGEWVYDHFDEIGGVAFLPASSDDHVFDQAPWEECTEEEYLALLAMTPSSIDWSLLSIYETEDQTTGSRELSCVAGACEVL